ncbi:hypothetical protein [Enterococcus faecium]|uniref:hypothetical protein n=1 Tax=Enterococcus faecium TaxID=1352 RepID=UPI001D037B51|nr:hypothetical protein [Enterococcus faecium]
MKLLNPKTVIAIGTFAATVALAGSADAASTNVMYRLYNPNNHEHFYTSSTKERDHLVKIKWGNYEGPAWKHRLAVATLSIVYTIKAFVITITQLVGMK